MRHQWRQTCRPLLVTTGSAAGIRGRKMLTWHKSGEFNDTVVAPTDWSKARFCVPKFMRLDLSSVLISITGLTPDQHRGETSAQWRQWQEVREWWAELLYLTLSSRCVTGGRSRKEKWMAGGENNPVQWEGKAKPNVSHQHYRQWEGPDRICWIVFFFFWWNSAKLFQILSKLGVAN